MLNASIRRTVIGTDGVSTDNVCAEGVCLMGPEYGIVENCLPYAVQVESTFFCVVLVCAMDSGATSRRNTGSQR